MLVALGVIHHVRIMNLPLIRLGTSGAVIHSEIFVPQVEFDRLVIDIQPSQKQDLSSSFHVTVAKS